MVLSILGFVLGIGFIVFGIATIVFGLYQIMWPLSQRKHKSYQKYILTFGVLTLICAISLIVLAGIFN
ncbi:hypothetical protein [Staphylococcus massiliensis]|uniref:Uncharacterized protein n=1 Tax=Staphylococcus massiliensis S46 TaxID=1229783 RepID=K9AVA2_9STAP|nr:hypothetical protein [Staphylococcus massiliensis]EKU50036.1 hypothetical protein C273_02168 [Staphylococcus massiliensis S46]MCG3399205.1 hypothetical protein [Staphylococcus massiliensis]MCG3402257.1 hypothetical protein [Staphylococcus massiliensis]MCG3412776.1 hypothetical protein [Staphylococcus massiliensis]POA00298.1 hypothetical protein CD133_04810 [Staphylococcus massiliensis CCUG 55927]